MAVGDIMLGDSPVCHGFGVNSKIKRYGPSYPFEHVADFLREGDLVLGNLEVPVSRFDEDRDEFERVQFRGQPESLKGVAESGVNIVSICTNHAMQHGRAAFEEMIDNLKSYDIAFVGTEIEEKGIENLYLIEKNGIKFAFLGYNFRPQQYYIDAPLWKTPTLDLIRRETDRYIKSVDCVVVSLHWGDEFIEYPSPEQVSIAHDLIDHGVKLIIGHHPHIVQGVESYRNGVIAYSLGNFVFDMWQDRLRETMILKCSIGKDGIENYNIIPVKINNSYQPELLTGSDAERLSGWFDELSRKITDDKNIESRYREELFRKTREFRSEIKSFYLKHLFKYDRKRFFENFVSAMKKRLGRGK